MSWFNDDLDRIDAAVFNSDALESVDNRKELKAMCERWLRAINGHEVASALGTTPAELMKPNAILQDLQFTPIQPPVIEDPAEADIAYILEAYDYGQFADDMLDHPSPSCRSPIKPLREALRRHLDRLAAQRT